LAKNEKNVGLQLKLSTVYAERLYSKRTHETAICLCRGVYRKDGSLKVAAESHGATSCSDYTWIWVSWEGDVIVHHISSYE